SPLHDGKQLVVTPIVPQGIEIRFHLEQARGPPGARLHRLGQHLDGLAVPTETRQETRSPVGDSLPMGAEVGRGSVERLQSLFVPSPAVVADDFVFYFGEPWRVHPSSCASVRAAATSGRSWIPSSRSCCSSTDAGASVRGSTPVCVLGKGMTSRIELSSCSTITSRSMPNAKPPWGGVPYRNASRNQPNRRWAVAASIPRISKTCCWTSGSWILIEPDPSSIPFSTASYAFESAVSGEVRIS